MSGTETSFAELERRFLAIDETNARDNSRDKGDDYESVNSYLSDIYSNIGTSVYSNTDTSVYSNNISDKSSYNSNVETSYDSFYDDKNFKNTWFIYHICFIAYDSRANI